MRLGPCLLFGGHTLPGARDLHQTVLRRWVQQYRDHPDAAFSGKGHMKPEDDEIRQLRREVVKLKAEREISKKSRGLLRQGPAVVFGVIAKHRGIWSAFALVDCYWSCWGN